MAADLREKSTYKEGPPVARLIRKTTFEKLKNILLTFLPST